MTELFTVEEMCTCLAPNTSNNLGKNAATNTKSNGEGWLVNKQEGMLIQIKPDAATQHAQFFLVSYYRL